MHTFTGRIDCKVETDQFIYLFEFKRDETAENALKQIEDKSYALPFAALYAASESADTPRVTFAASVPMRMSAVALA